MENNISVVNICAGCFGCGDVCPKNAISYVKNKDGFLYPKIDKSKCINCGKCKKVCPQLNNEHNKEFKQKGYISYSNNEKIYNNTASGGIFSELAKYFLENNGIVYGAAFENLKVKHIKIDNIKDLEKIQRSKYIQSNTVGIYKDCKNELDNGRQVLFSGTPCQISALKNYLGIEYENLLTCDLVCTGVPSQDMFDKCIELENKKLKEKIIHFDFRYKCNKNTSPRNFRYIFEKNGKKKEKIGNYYDFSFLIGFYNHFVLRDSCYECKYASMDRLGDLTLGDYWGVKDKRYSMIIVNTYKGNTYLEKIKSNLYIEEENMDLIIKGNETLSSPTEKPKIRDEFMNLCNDNFEKAVKKYFKVKHKFILKFYHSMPRCIKKFIRIIMNPRKK